MPRRAGRLAMAFLVLVPSLGEAAVQDAFTVVGLPLEVQASYRPGKWLGIGLYGFANFNDRRSFAGGYAGSPGRPPPLTRD